MNAMKGFLNLYNENEYICIFDLENKKNDFVKISEAKKMDFNNKKNVFFTPNTLGFRHGKIWRNANHLENFNCLYCDIDLKDHEDYEYVTEDMVIEYAKEHIFDCDLPYPTMINKSGNGIHLYWKINPISYKGNIEKWIYMQNYIYECFKRSGADNKVSTDTVRVLRISDSLNVKETTTKCENVEVNDNVYDLMGLLQEFTDYKEEKIKKFKKKNNKKNSNNSYVEKHFVKGHTIPFFAKLYKMRLLDLETLLIKYRDYVGGYRENILFLYRYYMNKLTENKEISLQATLELNAKLNNPLKEKECIRATKSSEGYAYGNQLNWTSSKVIDFLCIQKNEMKDLCSLINDEEKKERKSKKNKEYYRQKLSENGAEIKEVSIRKRQISIYYLLQEGKNRQEICSILNISKSTYYNDLKVIESEDFVVENEVEEMEEIMENTGTDDTFAVINNMIITDVFAYSKNFSPYNYKCSGVNVYMPKVNGYKKKIRYNKGRDKP